MNIDYKRLKESVAAIVHEVESGEKDAIRRPTVRLRVVRDLQGEATAGPFIFRTDAAIDAGGFAEHPRPWTICSRRLPAASRCGAFAGPHKTMSSCRTW